MISGEAALTRCAAERQRLITEQLKSALKLCGRELPKASRVGVTELAKEVSAVTPKRRKIAGYALHTL